MERKYGRCLVLETKEYEKLMLQLGHIRIGTVPFKTLKSSTKFWEGFSENLFRYSLREDSVTLHCKSLMRFKRKIWTITKKRRHNKYLHLSWSKGAPLHFGRPKESGDFDQFGLEKQTFPRNALVKSGVWRWYRASFSGTIGAHESAWWRWFSVFSPQSSCSVPVKKRWKSAPFQRCSLHGIYRKNWQRFFTFHQHNVRRPVWLVEPSNLVRNLKRGPTPCTAPLAQMSRQGGRLPGFKWSGLGLTSLVLYHIGLAGGHQKKEMLIVLKMKCVTWAFVNSWCFERGVRAYRTSSFWSTKQSMLFCSIFFT